MQTTNSNTTGWASIEALQAEIEKVRAECATPGKRVGDMKRPTWIVHPDNLKWHSLSRDRVDGPSQYELDGDPRGVFGFPIVTSPAMPRTIVEQRPPVERFVEYGPEDLEWLRFFGLLVDHDTGKRAISLFDAEMLSRLLHIQFSK